VQTCKKQSLRCLMVGDAVVFNHFQSRPPLAAKVKSPPYFLALKVLLITLLLLFCRDSSLSSLRGLIRGGTENSVDAGASPGASLTSPSSALGTPATAALQVLINPMKLQRLMYVCTCQKCNTDSHHNIHNHAFTRT
jgi:hypothetical protein